MHRILAVMLLVIAPVTATADEAQIRKGLEGKLDAARIEGIAPAPVPGLWELRYRTREGTQVFYVDATGSHLIQGRIIDLRTDRDLTAERSRKLNAIRFASLPLDQAIKIQRGNGRRVLAIFSDPYCPACRRFESSLLKVEDISVYVFMYPVIRPENADHSRSVWCSADRARAWLELAAAARPKVPAAGPGCANPVDKNLDLGRKLKINATPTLYFANGERTNGGLALDDLRELLDQAAAGN